jgi:hypothetical protein
MSYPPWKKVHFQNRPFLFQTFAFPLCPPIFSPPLSSKKFHANQKKDLTRITQPKKVPKKYKKILDKTEGPHPTHHRLGATGIL